jgi:transposase
VDRTVAWTVIAEMGTDMTVFPDAGHAASWVGVCPGTNESAGKQMDAGTTKGNRYLRRALLQAAWGATRKKDCFLQAFFHRLKNRRGWPKAIMALAHKLLVLIYEIMRTRQPYRELGGDYYDRLHPERTVRRLVDRLERLGVEVTLQVKEEHA